MSTSKSVPGLETEFLIKKAPNQRPKALVWKKKSQPLFRFSIWTLRYCLRRENAASFPAPLSQYVQSNNNACWLQTQWAPFVYSAPKIIQRIPNWLFHLNEACFIAAWKRFSSCFYRIRTVDLFSYRKRTLVQTLRPPSMYIFCVRTSSSNKAPFRVI